MTVVALGDLLFSMWPLAVLFALLALVVMPGQPPPPPPPPRTPRSSRKRSSRSKSPAPASPEQTQQRQQWRRKHPLSGLDLAVPALAVLLYALSGCSAALREYGGTVATVPVQTRAGRVFVEGREGSDLRAAVAMACGLAGDSGGGAATEAAKEACIDGRAADLRHLFGVVRQRSTERPPLLRWFWDQHYEVELGGGAARLSVQFHLGGDLRVTAAQFVADYGVVFPELLEQRVAVEAQLVAKMEDMTMRRAVMATALVLVLAAAYTSAWYWRKRQQ